MFCLPKHLVDSFLEKLRSGEIDPEKLSEMTSKERNDFFKSFMGEANATKVNALFESKLLLKNQQQGMINWAKQVSGLKPQVKKDLLSKIERMNSILQPEDMDSFLSDLAEKRLGFGVTAEEAGKIADLAKTVSEKKALIDRKSPNGSPSRLEYGIAKVVFDDYVMGLKNESLKPSFQELMTSPGELIQKIGGITKSAVSTLDNSFFGRQGLMTLITEPVIWTKGFLKSWGDIAKELGGVDAMLPIKAELYSRENALNGNYDKIKLDINVGSEEAFPEKLPLLGRLAKASQSAYNGGALRFRGDLADRYIEELKDSEIDLGESGIGELINSMTGRGKVDLTPGQSKAINVLIFSIKLLKANIDVLTAHAFSKNMSPEVRKKAASNLAKLIIAMAATFGISKMLDPDSVELDPRSSDFGSILKGKNREIKIGISGGFGSLVTLASRITPSMHNGKWGFWMKNSKGKYTNLSEGKYGTSDPSEVIFNFMKGKSSPVTRLLLTAWKGSDYSGKKPTLTGSIEEAITPIPIGNMFDLAKTSAGADPLLYSILTALDLIGVNVNTKQKRQKRR